MGGLQRRLKLRTAALWLAGKVEVRRYVGVKRETEGMEVLLRHINLFNVRQTDSSEHRRRDMLHHRAIKQEMKYNLWQGSIIFLIIAGLRVDYLSYSVPAYQ